MNSRRVLRPAGRARLGAAVRHFDLAQDNLGIMKDAEQFARAPSTASGNRPWVGAELIFAVQRLSSVSAHVNTLSFTLPVSYKPLQDKP